MHGGESPDFMLERNGHLPSPYAYNHKAQMGHRTSELNTPIGMPSGLIEAKLHQSLSSKRRPLRGRRRCPCSPRLKRYSDPLGRGNEAHIRPWESLKSMVGAAFVVGEDRPSGQLRGVMPNGSRSDKHARPFCTGYVARKEAELGVDLALRHADARAHVARSGSSGRCAGCHLAWAANDTLRAVAFSEAM